VHSHAATPEARATPFPASRGRHPDLRRPSSRLPDAAAVAEVWNGSGTEKSAGPTKKGESFAVSPEREEGPH
jgi:hypothetical protein